MPKPTNAGVAWAVISVPWVRLWVVVWLFCVGYFKMGFWWATLAFFTWPFYVGQHFAGVLEP